MILRPYQETGRDFLAGKRFALLADEMRVGKTPQAILAAQKIGAESALVVCPAIACEHWRREWRKWWPSAPSSNWPVVVSYDGAKNNRTELLSRHWDVVIVDEAHFAKNPSAERTKLVYGKGGLGWHCDHLWALSGTPAPKHAGELWPMLRAFGAVGLDYAAFCRRYCTMNKWTGAIIGTNTYRIPELKAILATIMLRRTRKEVAPEMPDIDFQFLEIDPTSHADLGAPSMLSDAEMLQWMSRNAATSSEDRVDVAMAKALPLVENIAFALDNGLLQQTVVFGWHREPLQCLAQALHVRGIKCDVITGSTHASQRVETQDAFRRGEIQVVVANILAAGTAIDLSAASHGYFLELDWVPGNNLQAANRLISMQKSEKVTFDIATWPGSADDRVQKVLMRRAKELANLL